MPFTQYALGWNTSDFLNEAAAEDARIKGLPPPPPIQGTDISGLLLPEKFKDPNAPYSNDFVVVSPDQATAWGDATLAAGMQKRDDANASWGEALTGAAGFVGTGLSALAAVAATFGAALPAIVGTVGGGMVLSSKALEGKASLGDIAGFGGLPDLGLSVPDFNIDVPEFGGSLSASDISGVLGTAQDVQGEYNNLSSSLDPVLGYFNSNPTSQELESFQSQLGGTKPGSAQSPTPVSGPNAVPASTESPKFNPMLLAGLFFLKR